jgi:hypothetical protein
VVLDRTEQVEAARAPRAALNAVQQVGPFAEPRPPR